MINFTEEQINFLKSSGKVVLHACPGSGKTTVVAQKMINYLQSWNRPHQGIAVLSFTNVASEEIGRQAAEMLPKGYCIDVPHFVGTLDSFIDNFIFLRFGYLLLKSPKRPMLISSDIVNSFQYWRRECHANCLSNIGDFRWNSDGELTRNGNKITCAGNKQFGPPCFQFKKWMLNKGLFFQEEIAGLACVLLKKYPEIAKGIVARFPIIILDEAQDTSKEQMEILDILCAAGLESVYIVGDPDQSIYEWRNANPESFLEKMQDVEWTQLVLTNNFRSSQLICNATHIFSNIYKNKSANKASGLYAGYSRKPIVFLYNKNISESAIIKKFKEVCTACDISCSPDKVAIVTRGRIRSNSVVNNLWKTPETELLAKASFEWMCGNRKKAYSFCEKALFQLIIKDSKDINISIEHDVSKIMAYSQWRQVVIEVLVKLPSAADPCGKWASDAVLSLQEVLTSHSIALLNGAAISDVIKIKVRDSKNPNFKQIPVKEVFEVKIQNEYTYSSVHGVKGESFDAMLLYIPGTRGSTLTPSFLASGDTNTELMRIAYVAMTRPRKLLAIAMPKNSVNLSVRFPPSTWDYIEL